MSHVFISYSTKNADYAKRLAARLREQGFDVWIDNAKLRSSENWWEKIVLALRDAAAVVVVMTPEAKSSKWVQREVTLADNWSKPTFPLLIDGDNWEIFVLTQFEDMRNGHLPAAGFYDNLGQYATRKSQPGMDITSGAAVTVDPTTLDADARLEIANPPLQESVVTSVEAVPTSQESEPIASASTEKLGRLTRRRLALSGLVILIFALVGGAGLLIRSTQMNQAQHLSATPTIIPIPTCTLVNTADSSVQPESTLDSLTPDSTLVGDSYGQLVFQSDMDGNSEIYLVDVDGTNLANLTQNPAADSVPAWSPDGSQIAFASNRDRTNENLPDRIFMMNADGSGQHSITGDINVFSPLSWSHITNLIAFVRLEENFNVYVINDDGSNTQQLTQNEFLSTNNLFGYISIVTWSPDGSQIAFSASRSINNDQIYVMNADGSGLCHLKPDSEFASLGAPAWSPDGNRVAFVSGRDGKNDIYVMDVDGTNSQNLTQNSAGDSFFPAWSPNGSQIAFSTDRDGEHLNIYVMNANGSNVRRVTNNQSDNRYPSWRPLPLSS